MVWRHFNYKRIQRQTVLERQQQYLETLERKKVLALAKRERVGLLLFCKLIVFCN